MCHVYYSKLICWYQNGQDREVKCHNIQKVHKRELNNLCDLAYVHLLTLSFSTGNLYQAIQFDISSSVNLSIYRDKYYFDNLSRSKILQMKYEGQNKTGESLLKNAYLFWSSDRETFIWRVCILEINSYKNCCDLEK